MRWRLLLPILLALVFTLTLPACAPGVASVPLTSGTVTPSAHAPTQPPCNPATQWQPPAGNTSLESLAMVSADEGWVTGELNQTATINGGPQAAAILYHLVHGQWQRLPQTYPGAALVSLAMDSPTDGWAVSPSPMTGGTHRLVLHYTSGVWRPVDVPALDAALKPPPEYLETGIMAMSLQMSGPSAGWLFAETDTPRIPSDPTSRPKVIILRYDGRQWVAIAGPPVAPTVHLFALSAVSPDDAWMVGTDYGSNSLTTYFYHYLHGAWVRAPQSFPFVTESVTMLSATDGWAGGESSDGHMLHYDGARWAIFPTPAALSKAGVTLSGPLISVAPGITWFVADHRDPSGQWADTLWQDANGAWSAVSWPYQDALPTAIAPGSTGEMWGISDINHQRGCPPLLTTFIPQGVFLHEVNGKWTRQVLP